MVDIVMHDLAAHQRMLLGLVRASHGPGAADDAYFHRVERSPDLQEARGNILMWRVYVLERTCVLTVELLRQMQRLEPTLQAFMRQRNVSPFREFQPLAFLEHLADDADGLLVSVSQFELALMRARDGDPTLRTVHWQVDPQPVLRALATRQPLDDAMLVPAACVTRVSAALPQRFEIERA